MFHSVTAGRPFIRPDIPTLPIAAARLTIAGQDLTARTVSDAVEAIFQVKLPRDKTQLHGWFQDADGEDLCGAFYAEVRRK